MYRTVLFRMHALHAQMNGRFDVLAFVVEPFIDVCMYMVTNV